MACYPCRWSGKHHAVYMEMTSLDLIYSFRPIAIAIAIVSVIDAHYSRGGRGGFSPAAYVITYTLWPAIPAFQVVSTMQYVREG